MTFYSDMNATVLELLAEFGASLVLIRKVSDAFDPVDGEVSSLVTSNNVINGVFVEWNESLLRSFGNVASEDRLLLIDSTIEPLTTDRITVGGDFLEIVNISPIKPAGTALAYYLQVRK